MKRLVTMITLLSVLFIVSGAVCETKVTHYIPEHEVSLSIPVSITCVSRESDETNAFYQSPYFDYATTHQYMLNNSLYLYGMTLDYMGEFALIISDGNDIDLDTADSLTLFSLRNEVKDMFSAQGATDIVTEIYQGEKHRAIRFHYKLKAEQVDQHVLFYYTTHGSKTLMLRFISFYSEITDSQEETIQNIFESIIWGKKEYSAAPKGETDINIYRDYETGLSFMVPSGWSEVKFVAEENSKKVKYRIGNENVWVLYESGDMWEDIKQSFGDLITAYDIKRKDIGNEILSKETVAAQLGCSESDVTMKTIGGQEYYCLNTANSISAGTISVETQDIVYICMRDSYMYWFQLSGVDISRYEDQFNRFMKTVEYPQ